MTRKPARSIAPAARASRTRAGLRATAIALATTLLPLASQGAAEPAPRAALVVTTAVSTRADWPAVVDAAGAIAAWQEASVAARSTGLPIVAVLAEVGDVVKKGQLLARFDDVTVRADVARAEAALAQARARAAQTAANRDRAVQLRESGALSRQDILRAETEADAGDAEVAQAQASLHSARLVLEHTRVVAPDAGVITSRSAALGAVAQPGTELFRLIRQGRLEWRAELTGTQLAQVKPGTRAHVVAADGTRVNGRVRRVSPALDASTRLGIVYVDLEPSAAARASMYVQGQLELATRSAVVVPAASVFVRDGRSYVAALDGTRVRLVQVTPGRRNAGQVEIAAGLEPGRTIVARGAGFLNDQDVVRVAAAPR